MKNSKRKKRRLQKSLRTKNRKMVRLLEVSYSNRIKMTKMEKKLLIMRKSQ